jgi:hypothetical protein
MSFGPMPHNLNVLARGMKDLHHFFVGHELEERREVDARRQCVDDHGLVCRGHLRHAQKRIIGGLAEEFGIDGDEGQRGHTPADGGELGRCRDRLHRGL